MRTLAALIVVVAVIWAAGLFAFADRIAPLHAHAAEPRARRRRRGPHRRGFQ